MYNCTMIEFWVICVLIYACKVLFVSPTELYLIYLEIVLSIESTNQKHDGFDVTISLLSWDNPLTTDQVWPGAFVHSLLIFFNEL